MNAKDRKQVTKIVEKLEEIKSDVDAMQVEQEDRFYNLPEGIQDSERGDEFQEAIENIESAASSIEEAIDYLNEILEG